MHTEYKEIVHRVKIDKLQDQFRKIREYLQVSAQIKIRYGWFRYLRIKAEKLRKQREEEAKEKKKARELAKKVSKTTVNVKRPGGSGMHAVVTKTVQYGGKQQPRVQQKVETVTAAAAKKVQTGTSTRETTIAVKEESTNEAQSPTQV